MDILEEFRFSKYLFDIIKGSSSPFYNNTDTSSIMETTPEILSRLKLIGHIRKGDKICVRNLFFQPDGWFTRLQRAFVTPDNRQNTYKFVRDVITRSFEILSHNITSPKESDIFQCKIMIQDLIRAQSGMLNLKHTYEDDCKFGCDIEVLLQLITARLSEIKKGYPKLFSSNPLEQGADEKDGKEEKVDEKTERNVHEINEFTM